MLAQYSLAGSWVAHFLDASPPDALSGCRQSAFTTGYTGVHGGTWGFVRGFLASG
jgi:hypothetical protein